MNIRTFSMVTLSVMLGLLVWSGCSQDGTLPVTDDEASWQITDAEGNPIDGAEVILAAPGVSAVSDAQGRYAFAQPPEADDEALLMRHGHIIARFLHPAFPSPVNRGIGILEGQVTDQAGTPIAEARLVLAGGWRIQVAITDETGHYVFPQAFAGPARLSVFKAGYIPVYTRVVVQSGETVAFDIQLEEVPPTSAVRGRVLASDGAPIDHAWVRLIADRSADTWHRGMHRFTKWFAVTDADGQFEITDVTVGAYTLHVVRPPYVPTAEDVLVEADAPLEIEITLLTPEEFAATKEFVRMNISGGFAGINRTILIQDLGDQIVLTDKAMRLGPSRSRVITEEAYGALWETLIANEVLALPTNLDMRAGVRDAFLYQIQVGHEGEQNHFSVYAPEILAEETGDARYANVVHAILDLVGEAPIQPDLFLVPNDAEAQERAGEVWETAQQRTEIQRLMAHDRIQVLIHRHAFSVGAFDPNTAEWVVIAATKPVGGHGMVNLGIVRLDYQTLRFKKGYVLSQPQHPVDRMGARRLMNEHPPYDWWNDWEADPEQMQQLGDFWVLSWPAGDFGGTMVVHGLTGQLIYSATTVWDGVGKQLIP